ncbi:hypothetical protein ACHAW6_001940, partial [Cyclotella cf. meneghiniana]
MNRPRQYCFTRCQFVKQKCAWFVLALSVALLISLQILVRDQEYAISSIFVAKNKIMLAKKHSSPDIESTSVSFESLAIMAEAKNHFAGNSTDLSASTNSIVPVSRNYSSGASGCHTDRLIYLIKSDPERYGLRPWSTFGRHNNTIHFRGLDHVLMKDAFRGRRIAILGDSTLRNLNQWLHQLLNTKNEASITALSSMNLTEANAYLMSTEWTKCNMNGSDKDLQCQGMSQYPVTNLDDGTKIQFIWAPPESHNVQSDECPELSSRFTTVMGVEPDIIIANMGLWWLHFQNIHRNVAGCVVEKWVNYEQWLESLVVLANVSKAKVLVFKTTNFICDEKYTGKYIEANRLYSNRDVNTLKHCYEDIRAKTSALMTDEDISNYCFNGTFNDAGSRFLNSRLHQFVERKELDSSSHVRLLVLNDHDIQSCKYTQIGNARHYQEMNLARIRLLGNILS